MPFLEPKQFRRAMSRFATGITVVSVRSGERTHGMTVNSFTSVSLDPPMVLWCAERGSRTLALVQESGVYGVSVLGEHQVDLSQHFAGRWTEGVDRFAGIDCFDGPATGCPLLRGALATFECRLAMDQAVGDHHVLLARVEDVRMPEEPGSPLLYFGSRYCFLADPAATG